MLLNTQVYTHKLNQVCVLVLAPQVQVVMLRYTKTIASGARAATAGASCKLTCKNISIFASIWMHRPRLIVGRTAAVRLVALWQYILLLVALRRGRVKKWRRYGLRVKVGGASWAHATGRPGHLLVWRLPPLMRIILL